MATLSDIMDLIDGVEDAKADLKTSIAGKGVTVPAAAKLAELPALVDDIEQGITPTGTLNISANGTYDVTEKASAVVNVPSIVPTGTKQISITANGTTTEDVAAYANAEITVNVSGGGGDEEEPEKDVNFIDYDGKILYSYTATEAQALTELPANPSHSGLTAQGWNWTLAEIKAQLTAVPGGPVWVGQMYITTSGATEIDIVLKGEDLSPYLAIAVNGTVTVDWGDGSTPDTMTGASLTTLVYQQHIYAAAGTYTISISGGAFAFYNTANSNASVMTISNGGSRSAKYSSAVTAVRLGANATLGASGFCFCISLTSVTIPSGVGVSGAEGYLFNNCYSLACCILPSSLTVVRDRLFQNCRALRRLSVPSGLLQYRNYSLAGCIALESFTIPAGLQMLGSYLFLGAAYSLKSLHVPSTISGIGSQSFGSPYQLSELTLPDSVTTIGGSAFSTCHNLRKLELPDALTTIENTAFANCQSLVSLTIPEHVTSIGATAFQNPYSLEELHLLPTTPPSLANANAFSGYQSYLVIYVPYSADHSILEAYKTATNWSTYASIMQEEPQ